MQEGRLLHQEMRQCQPAPCDGNHGPILQLQTAPLAFHLWRSFLAIQQADNVNNTNNNNNKIASSVRQDAKFPCLFFWHGAKGWKLNNALPEPLKAQHL